jgi:ribosomal protein L11 methyltransferase
MSKPPLYRLTISPFHSIEDVWHDLEAMGTEVLYSSEEEGNKEIFAHLSSTELLASIPAVTFFEPYVLPPINWSAQWAEHAPHFQNGCVEINLSAWGREGCLFLQPGAGFGDLSHPTTRLMLHMLAQHLNNQIVVDIGCGSGVLMLSALAMGAPYAYGIDIDPQAISHACENARLNHLDKNCQIILHSDFSWRSLSQPVLVLMNMIRSEQCDAWSFLTALHAQPCEILTSGIQVEECDIYLEKMHAFGWQIKQVQENMGWLAFHFIYQLNNAQ